MARRSRFYASLDRVAKWGNRMRADKLLTIEDLRALAKKRVPKLAFDYLDGGAGSEANIRRNRDGFAAITLKPEYMRDMSVRDQAVALFGHTYDAPIGVSPVGLTGVIWPRTDSILAAMAARRNVPYVLSAVASTAIEDIARVSEGRAWFQIYMKQETEISFDLIRRAKEAGMKVLFVTVDIPVSAKRHRDLRNGFTLPFKMRPDIVFDIARKPAWALATLRAGKPRFENFAPYIQDVADGVSLSAAQAVQISPALGEDLMGRIRDAWDGPMVIKGLLSVESAETAKRVGADGIVVSNHGGRQHDSFPSSIEALPAIVDAVGKDMTILFDSGIRTGGDVVKAYCLGADYVFSGRSFVFGVGALGAAGGEHVLDLFIDEVDRTLAQIGCKAISELGPDYLWNPE